MSGPAILNQHGLTAFVPDGESRRDTAIILIGSAREYGLDDAKAVQAARGGFYISDELADLLNAEQEAEPGKQSRSPRKKTSGNRAAKNTDSKEE
jgi:hypothetical protein